MSDIKNLSLVSPTLAVRPLESDVSDFIKGTIDLSRRLTGYGEVLQIGDSVPQPFKDQVREGDRVIYHLGMNKKLSLGGQDVHVVYWFDVEAVVPEGVSVDVDTPQLGSQPL